MGFALLALAAAHSDSRAQGTPPSAPPAGVIAIASRTLTFVPTRDDISVGVAILSVYCGDPARVRIDGRAPEAAWTTIELARVERDRFALPTLQVVHPPDVLVCLSIKVWFAEVGNQHDALLYEDLDDRYALVSFATRTDGPDWERARPRFTQNRAPTLAAFDDALSRPLPIRLNQRPLSELPSPR